jgi:integrase
MTKFKIVNIDATIKGVRHQHAVLVYIPKKHLLSYLTIWLGKHTYKTGKEYAKVFQRFCSYLANNRFTDEEMLLSFWRYIMVEEIIAWKTYRILEKYDKNKVSPSLATIDREAHIVCEFLDWVKWDKCLNTLWDGKRKTIRQAKQIHSDILRGISGPKEIEVVDVDLNVSTFPDNKDYPAEGLAKKLQSRPHEYLHDKQVSIVISAFSDKVFKFISLLCYLTGLRPFEALAVPYWHTYQDGTVFVSDPHLIRKRLAEDEKEGRKIKVMTLKVLGKGKKERLVTVDTESWLSIMEAWAPLYQERKEKYEDRTGEALPLSILWLDKSGTPIWCPPQDDREHERPLKKLQNAFYYISKGRKKDQLSVKFGHKIDYYCFRHTFATNYILRVMEARRERTKDAYLEDYSLRHDLANQMGHSDIGMTFSHYVDNAWIILKDREAGKGSPNFPTLKDILNYGKVENGATDDPSSQ